MTHLAADIRISSIDVLNWALLVAGQALVSCAGGWVKTMKCFMALFGWSYESQKESWFSAKASFGKTGSDTAAAVKLLNSLATFMQAGLSNPQNFKASEEKTIGFPLWHNLQHQRTCRSNCYAYLNLFGLPRDEDSEIYEDYEERKKVFQNKFRGTIEEGLDSAKREGGEVGRAAGGAKKVILETMAEYQDGDL